jgi:MFS family permease
VPSTFRHAFSALRSKDFRVWAAADVVSVTGTWMQALAVNWYVLQLTGSTAMMGLTVLLQTLPSLLLGPLGGVVADRIRAKPALVATQLTHAALAAGLAVVAATGGGLPLIYALCVIGGLVASVEGPIMGRFSATIVDRSVLGNALSLGSLINSTGRILGMAMGGVVLAATGAAPLFAANAVSFFAVIGVLLTIRPKHAGPEPTAEAAPKSRGLRAGLAYVARQPVVLAVLGLSLVLGSFGRNYQVTMAAMSAGPLGGGAAGYGILSAAFAAGTVLGGLVAASRTELGLRTLIGMGVVTSVLQIAGGLAPSVAALAGIVVPVALGAVLIDTTVGTRIQLDTDWSLRGRVLGVAAAVSGASGALGAPVLGALSQAVGPRATLVAAGLVTLAASAIAGVVIARLRGTPLSIDEALHTMRTALGLAPAPRLSGRFVPSPQESLSE